MGRGELVADRFEIEERVGWGSMGSVHRALDRQTGELVALKMMNRAEFSARFVREARVLAELHHPAVVRYVAHGPLPSGEPFLAMEWLDGEDLSRRLRRGALTLGATVTLAMRIAAALGAAHARKIVHRDVKPANIFLPGGDVAQAKLLDFGIAHVIEGTRIATQNGAVIGTPGYMAPEQAKGLVGIDARADIFSLGCVLYRCLSGRAPFVGEDLVAVLAKLVLEEPPSFSALGVEVPAALEELVAAMMAKVPDDRPPEGTAVFQAFADLDLSVSAFDDAAEDEAPAAKSISGAERRIVSVVVVAGARDESAPTMEAAAPGEGVDPRSSRVLEAFGAQLVALADGSLVATLRGDGQPTDQAARAARYALALRAAFPARAMVLATGRAVDGRVPLGEVVDRAAALLGRTVSWTGEGPRLDLEVRLDDVTAGLLSHRFEIGGDAISLFLLREREPFAGPPRTLLGTPSSFVGRERELAMLDASYQGCASGPEASAVVVTAPAGVGKSRLGSEFLRRIEGREPSVEIWIARGDSVGAGAPFGMLGQAIRMCARIRDGEPVEVRRQKLRARLSRQLSERDLPRVAEFLGELSGTPFPDEGRLELQAARQDPVQMGDGMRRAWEDFLAAECGAGPVVIVLEDLHWGDLPSVQMIDAALRNLQGCPILILALCRPEVDAIFPGLWAERCTLSIRLMELPARASERMVQEALGAAARPEVVRRIIDRAGGNAFYLEELIRAVAEGRGVELPETVLAMVEARLAALPVDARRVLRAASIFGQTFWKGGVAALLGQEASGATPWLEELSRREVITRRREGKFSDEEEYFFHHSPVRDAAYAMLTEADQRLGHRLAAAWLEKAGEADAAVLADHLERAGEPARAVGLYLRAAEQALEGNDFAASLRQAKRGVACGAAGELKGALFLVQAEANHCIGHNVEAEACAMEAKHLLPRKSSRWFRAVAELSLSSIKLGGDDRLIPLSQELFGIDGGEAPGTYASAAARVAIHLIMSGQRELGDRLLTEVEATAAGTPVLEPVVSAYIARGRAAQRILAGDVAAFLRLTREAMEGFARVGAQRATIGERGNLGFAYLELGAYAEAEEVLQQALIEAERMGLRELSAEVRQNLALALAQRGALDEALAMVTAARDAAIAYSSRRLEGFCRIYRAMILLSARDAPSAAEEARAAAAIPAIAGALRAYALAVLSQALLAERLAEEALPFALEAMALLRSASSIEAGEARILLAHVEALVASGAKGDTAAVREALVAARARLLSRADKIGDPAWRRSFLERVPENARILALARAFLDVPAA